MGATMDRQAWAAPMNAIEAYRRAGGRRRYNAALRRAANRRLIPLIRQIAAMGDLDGQWMKQPKPLPRHLIPALAKVLGLGQARGGGGGVRAWWTGGTVRAP